MNKWHIITILLAIVYIAILLKLILFKHPVDFTFTTSFSSLALNSNFIPFKTILGYLGGDPSWHIAIRNLAGNLILFVPFGVFLALIFRTVTWKSVLVTAVLFSLFLEIIQVFIPGTPDIDDVLLNTLGAVIGFFVYVRIVTLLKRSNHSA